MSLDLTNTFIHCTMCPSGIGSHIYWQDECLAMGLPLSPAMANIYIYIYIYIYMDYFEEMALESISLKPTIWLRYWDDTLILWPHQEDVQILLDHVNSIRPSIQFTMQKESNNTLTFLDVLVEVKYLKQSKEFKTSVYRKPTFTGQYLNFYSHHPYSVKKGFVSCSQHWAKVMWRPRDIR